jgi:HK97 family phage major capsid protein
MKLTPQQQHDMLHRGLELSRKSRLTEAEQHELEVITEKARALKRDKAIDEFTAGGRSSGASDLDDPDFRIGVGRFTGKAIHNAVESRFARGKAVIEGGSLLVPAARDSELYGKPQQPRFVQDVIPSKIEPSKNVTYLRQSVRTNLAAVVAEGALKPTSVYTMTEEEASAKTFAHMSEYVPNQLFSDSSMLMGWLQQELAYGLDLAVEADAIATIIADAGMLTQTFSTDIFTSIRKGVTKLGKSPNFITPTIMVLAPEDAEAIDLVQDVNDRYYFNGPQGAGSSPVWSVPVLVSDAAVQGSALLMNPGAGLRRYVRETARVDIDPYTRFDKNETRVRIESRSVVAVNRPFAICLVDIGTPTS